MAIIELIGPPGGGKSTLIHKLLQETDDLQQPSVEQYFHNNASKKLTLPYQFAPAILTDRFKKLINPYCRRRSLYEFIESNPTFFACISYVRNTQRPEYFLKLFLKGAERRQLANTTISDEAMMVLDENLCQYGAHMMTESRLDPTFSDIQDFFASFTSPDVLIHVDPPSDVGIKRQRQRQRGIHSFVNHVPEKYRNPIEAQERFSRMCELVARNLNSKVIRVENTESIENTTKKIIEKLALSS